MDLATRIRAFTLFATHYFELTVLPDLHDGIANVHLDAVEHDDRIVFLHAVKDGAADRSYGLHVAALAGVPQTVIDQARRRLSELETAGGPLTVQHTNNLQPGLFDAIHHPLLDVLEEINPDDLTPRQAHELLYALKELSQQKLDS